MECYRSVVSFMNDYEMREKAICVSPANDIMIMHIVNICIKDLSHTWGDDS